MKTNPKMIIPREEDEQKALVKWLRIKGWRFTHIAHGGNYSRNLGVKLKAMGLSPGVPDLMIIVPERGLVFIELKRQKGGVISAEQCDWIDALDDCPGVRCTVCKGCMPAIEYLNNLTKNA